MKKLVVIGLMAALACVSAAQGGGGGGRMMRFGGGGMGIRFALRGDVSKELALTAEQKVKLDKAAEEMRPQRMNGGGGPGGGPGGGGGGFSMDEMRKRMEERRAQEKKLLEGTLSAEQMKRLRELSIQRSGNMAITDGDTQKELGFTDAQKKQVETLMAKSQEATMAIIEKMRNQEIDREASGPLFEKNRKIMDEELLKILTADQKKKFADMGGKPFKFDPEEDQIRFGG